MLMPVGCGWHSGPGTHWGWVREGSLLPAHLKAQEEEGGWVELSTSEQSAGYVKGLLSKDTK